MRKILKKFEMSPDFVMLRADDLEGLPSGATRIFNVPAMQDQTNWVLEPAVTPFIELSIETSVTSP